MGNETDFLNDYIFYGADVEGLTNNDIEIMEYLYGDDPLAPPLNIQWTPPPNDVRQTSNIEGESLQKYLISLFRPTPETPQSKEESIRHIKIACEDSKSMSIRDFVVKYNPSWISKTHSTILCGIQVADTIVGAVDIDWAITLAGINLGVFRVGIVPNMLLYSVGKPTWNVLRGYNILNNVTNAEERRAIAMADLMTYGGMKFHEFFPWY